MNQSNVLYRDGIPDAEASQFERANQIREAVFDAMAEAVIVFDSIGRPIMANPAATRIFGVDATGKPMKDLIRSNVLRHLDGSPVQPEELPSRAALAGKEVRGARYCYTTPTGEDVIIRTSAVPLVANDAITGAITVSTDLSREAILLRELEAERALLDALIDCAPVGIVMADAEARIVRTNRTADAIYAHPIPLGEPYPSHETLALLREDGSPYPARDLPLTRAALDGVEMRHTAMRIRWPDDQERDLLVQSAPILSTDMTITGAIGVVQDISERKQEQRALRRYADRIATLRTIDRLILTASSAAELAIGVIPQVRQLLGFDYISLVQIVDEKFELLASCPEAQGPEQASAPPGGAEADSIGALIRGTTGAARITDMLQRGEIVTLEDHNASRNLPDIARRLHIQGLRALTVAPLRDNGKLVGALVAGRREPGSGDGLPEGDETAEMLRDVTDQLAIGLRQTRLREEIAAHAAQLEWTVAQRTAALRTSEMTFRAVFEQAAAGIFTATLQGQIIRHNAALSRILGYGRGDLEKLALRHIDHPEDAPEAEERFARLAAGQTPDYQVEQRYLCQDGREIVGRLTVSLVRNADQAPAFAVGILEDITDEKLAHEAMIQAEKLSVTSQLVAAVTHEINNPLQTVLGCMGLFQESLEDARAAKTNPYLGMAMQELRRITSIVNELRDLHRKSSPEDKEMTDLAGIVQHVVSLAAYKAKERDVDIVWSAPDDLPIVLPLVTARIRQVFLNLIFNAVDAMPDGGRIQIDLMRTTQPPGATIRFTDSGVGIPEALMPHLFEPFQTTKTTGMGMGLYICRSIVHEHEGRIDVESTPGRGSTFTIWLPRPVVKQA